jgi:hypothetical protein
MLDDVRTSPSGHAEPLVLLPARRWTRFWRSALATALAGFATVGVFAGLTSPASAAEGSQAGCTATINGIDAYTASSPGDAVSLDKDEQVEVLGAMNSGPITYTVQMEFAGISWDVADGTGDGNQWSAVLEVNEYTKYGVGLYKVKVAASSASGDQCNLTTYVKVKGSLLSGTAGKVGVGALAVGGAALFGSSFAAAYGAKAAATAAKWIKFGWK